MTDGGQRLKDRIQLLKELIPIKEREYKAKHDEGDRGRRRG